MKDDYTKKRMGIETHPKGWATLTKIVTSSSNPTASGGAPMVGLPCFKIH
jgi:hypothetical protein